MSIVTEGPAPRRPPSGVHERVLVTQRDPGELVQAVAREFFDAAPVGWVTGRIVYRRVGKTAESQATAEGADGGLLNVELSRDARLTLKELRAAMARPHTGAWLTAIAHLSSDGRMAWEFDRDHEPEWFVRISPLHYLQEQDQFPRDDAHTPDWLRTRLAQAQAFGGL